MLTALLRRHVHSPMLAALRFPTWCLLLSLSHIAACTLLAPITALDQITTEQDASAARTDLDNCTVSAEEYAAFAPLEKPLIWERIRGQLGLSLADNPRVAKERKRYLQSPEGLANILKRGEPYLFHIVEQLDKQDMPLAIALLPAVESGFDPFAYSHGRAAGIWQFIPGTGKMLGLEQNWWYDGRRDIVRSTDAALTYLSRHHERFDGDWLLALASYNSGAGNVSKALKKNQARQQGTDYWSLRLPKETLAYVPRLIALSQIIADPAHYGVDLPAIENRAYFTAVDTGSQIDLSQIADLAQITMDEVYQLNPAFNQWATHPDGPHTVLIPVASRPVFERAFAALPAEERITWQRYTIRSGDALSTIARRFGIDVATLRSINALKSDRIRAGQTLIVPTPGEHEVHYSQSIQRRLEKKQAAVGKRFKGTRIDHLVSSGESFWSIGQRYGVNAAHIAKWNNMAPADPIRPGQRLAIWTKNPSTPVTASNGVIRKVSYTVRSGDSLARIASKFRLRVKDILSWNTINPKKYLQPGDSLTLFVDVTRVN